jgi:hypothetical protein
MSATVRKRLSATKAGGNAVATIAFGGRRRVLDTVDFGTGVELPITDRHDVFGWRVYPDLIRRPMGWSTLL